MSKNPSRTVLQETFLNMNTVLGWSLKKAETESEFNVHIIKFEMKTENLVQKLSTFSSSFYVCRIQKVSGWINKLEEKKKKENRTTMNLKFPLSGNYLWTEKNKCNRMNERVNKRKELNMNHLDSRFWWELKLFAEWERSFHFRSCQLTTAAVEVWIAVAVFNVLWNWIPADSRKVKIRKQE